jgi:mannose-6-phosphate isomerase-like protein (cupin superfamily)
MYIHHQPAPAETPIPGVAHVTLAGSDDGLEHLSVWRQSMAPGHCTPPHSHSCEEVVLCESGQGEIHIDGVVYAFGPRQTIVLPAHVPHQIFNTGREPLVSMAILSATPVPVTLPDGTALELPWRS